MKKSDFIAIAKGIGIMFMVLAHTSCPKYMSHFIYMFHMPLFFFISGYCLKEKYLMSTAWLFFIKRIKGLYKPFVKWSLFFLILHNIFYYLNIYNGTYGYNNEVSILYTAKDYAINLFKILIMFEPEQLLGGYWFFKSLLLASLLGYFIIRHKRFTKWWICMLVVISISLSFFHIQTPGLMFGIRDVLAVLFYILGYYYHKRCYLNFNIWMGIGAFLIVVLGTFLWHSSMSSVEYWAVIPYMVTAVLGTLLIFYLSSQIESHTKRLSSIFVFVGNNTLTILTWHFLCFKLVSLLIIGIYGLQIERLAEFPVIIEYSEQGWFLLYTIVGIIIPIVIPMLKTNEKINSIKIKL